LRCAAGLAPPLPLRLPPAHETAGDQSSSQEEGNITFWDVNLIRNGDPEDTHRSDLTLIACKNRHP